LAAELYRALRKTGITIRKSADCLIAFYALTSNITLLHNDDDINLIAKKSELKIHTLSRK
jgi:predicted nucleic acid-binding protein